MKKIIGSLLLLTVMATAFSQQPTSQVKDKQYYLDKSQSKKTTAWILLGAGTVAAVVGYIGASNQDTWSFAKSGGDANSLLFAGGVIADLACIPFFVSAAHYKNLAADITIGNQNRYLLKQNSIAMSKIPALIIKIHFR